MIFTTQIHGESETMVFIHHSGASRIPRRILVATVQLAVAEHYGLDADVMKSRVRGKQDVTHKRQIAMYLARKLTDKSLPDIGRRFGNRHHTTVMHAVREVEKRISKSVLIAEAVETIRERLAA